MQAVQDPETNNQTTLETRKRSNKAAKTLKGLMSLSAIAAGLALMSHASEQLVVKANGLPLLDYNCIPCITFRGYYCFDDPQKVNQNGDKCYEHYVDKLECQGFKFSNDIKDCYGVKLKKSDGCKLPDKLVFPVTLKITLEPRSQCGFSIYTHKATFATQHEYPVVLQVDQNNKEIDMYDIDRLIWKGSREAPGNCLFEACETNFAIEEKFMHFWITNWDNSKSQTSSVTITENEEMATRTQQSIVAVIASVLSVCAMFNL